MLNLPSFLHTKPLSATATAPKKRWYNRQSPVVRMWYIGMAGWFGYLVWQLLGIEGNSGTPLAAPDWTTKTDAEPFDPTRLIFLLSFGAQAANSTIVERFVWSARHRGEYRGYILLLTDAPTERYSRLDASVLRRLVVLNPDPGDLDTRFKEDMPYKRFKTMVIEYTSKVAKLDAVELIYYLDVDNMVGNSLPAMFADLETKYHIVPSNQQPWIRTVPKLWFFANKYKNKSVQGGQFVVDRHSSGPCLEAWREAIDANLTEPKDQPALHRIRGNGRNQDCQIVVMLPRRHIYFPSMDTMPKDVALLDKGYALDYPALVHIKNSCNKTARVDTAIEERYVMDIVGHQEYSKKIRVKPD